MKDLILWHIRQVFPVMESYESGLYEEMLNFVSPPLGDAVVLQMKADEQEEITKISINRQ